MVDVNDILCIAMTRGSANFYFGVAKRAQGRREEEMIVLEAADTKETSPKGAQSKPKHKNPELRVIHTVKAIAWRCSCL